MFAKRQFFRVVCSEGGQHPQTAPKCFKTLAYSGIISLSLYIYIYAYISLSLSEEVFLCRKPSEESETHRLENAVWTP